MKKKYKELKIIKKSSTIDVSADELWKILGPGFEDVGTWATGVDRSTGTGESEFEGATCSMRTCHVNFPGYDTVTEELTFYSDDKRELAYKVSEGMPGFVIHASNHWTIIEISKEQSAVQMNVSVHLTGIMGALMGGMMKRNFSKNIDVVLDELKLYAETGQLSQAKEARMKKLKK